MIKRGRPAFGLEGFEVMKNILLPFFDEIS